MDKHIQRQTLGNTDIKVSQLGFGAASLGNLYHKVSELDSSATLTAAISAGLNLYDTAPRYGLGLSERRVGNALRELARDSYVVSTKVGRILTPDRHANTSELRYGFDTPMPFDAHYDYSYDGIMRSYEDSLQRLGLASIDVLLVHDIGKLTHGEQDSHYFKQLETSGYKALEELRSSKQIRAVGLGVNETQVCERAMHIGQFDCFLLAGRYSLLEQGAIDSFLPKCMEHGASVILGGPYNSGILATGVSNNPNATYDYEPAPKHIIERVAKIENICQDHKVSLAAAALQFPIAHPAVATVIPGMGTGARVEKTVQLFNQVISDDFWQELKAEGLIQANAPVPGEVEADAR
ncbi:aldo/keto reductase [Paraferrimonas sp. SM1919]|uniref:aldo/keto reductase n=1 Tax=Paraferrimonas sp. SM1919 TaxID=2662263 RepID=UPI0013D77FC5|nr:aldo/keto reductase [Paraferrimonas sp. SM1919]